MHWRMMVRTTTAMILYLGALAFTVFGPAVLTACTQEQHLLDNVRDGNAKAVKVQLDRGANVNDATGKPLLIVAAELGHTEVVRVLLDHGANVDATTSADQTALVSAAHRGHSDIVKALLAAGANVEGKGDYTPLMAAATKGHREVVSLLLA